jgi:uncharacterized protein (DUF2147 family)
MKRYFLLIVAMISLAPFSTGLGTMINNHQGDDILGEWFTDEKEAVVRIYKNRHGFYFGKITWLKNPKEKSGQPKLDKENPDPKLRNQPIIDLVILRGFRFESGRWTDGTIYDPDNGKTYKCTIRMESDNELHVRGYIGVSALGRTTTWTRKRS